MHFVGRVLRRLAETTEKLKEKEKEEKADKKKEKEKDKDAAELQNGAIGLPFDPATCTMRTRIAFEVHNTVLDVCSLDFCT